jgi:DNA-binding HxlR family transcriptional regulator
MPALDLSTISQLIRSGPGHLALQQFGDRWSFLIMREMFLGVHRFEDLRRLTGAARGTLTERLAALTELGILYRNPYQTAPTRYEYRLTDKGLALFPMLLLMWDWESRWAADGRQMPKLVHATCRKRTRPTLICAHCRAVVQPREVSFAPGPGAGHPVVEGSGYRRREPGRRTAADGIERTLFHVIDVVGDRWSAVVLATLFFGLHRYDDINAALGIATNILSDRLKRLAKGGLIERSRYQDRPARFEYRLTQKGWDLYPWNLALHEWATRWLPWPRGSGLVLRHAPCGKLLRAVVVCSECDGPIEHQDVRLHPNPRWATIRRERTPPPLRPAARR